MTNFYKYVRIISIIVTILLTCVALYGNTNRGWASTIVIYHGEGDRYYPPITIFERREEGYIVHRTFMMFPKGLHPPKLVMLTTTEDDSIVWTSYFSFWVVLLIYVSGWFNLGFLLFKRFMKKKSNPTLQGTCL